MRQSLQAAVERLRNPCEQLDWVHHNLIVDGQHERVFDFPGPPEENIVITVNQSGGTQEPFHRHDYFYFNYTYQGEYEFISRKYERKTVVRKRELYAGQPFAGHSLYVHDNHETVVISILIRKEAFFRTFLPMLPKNAKLLRFFLDPVTNSYSDEYIHFKVSDDCIIPELLELIVLEYTKRQKNTQDLLKPLVLSFLVQVAQQYILTLQKQIPEKQSDKIIQYMWDRFDSLSLKTIADHFSYHPNYVSTLLRRETGKSFSELLLEQRMVRAVLLLQGTDLSIHEIASMVGYSDSSNFYKAFREYYHMSPREYIKKGYIKKSKGETQECPHS